MIPLPQAVHRQWTYPGPGNRTLGGMNTRARVWLTYWGHCDDTRPFAKFADGKRFLVFRFHRLALYIRLRRG